VKFEGTKEALLGRRSELQRRQSAIDAAREAEVRMRRRTDGIAAGEKAPRRSEGILSTITSAAGRALRYSKTKEDQKDVTTHRPRGFDPVGFPLKNRIERDCNGACLKVEFGGEHRLMHIPIHQS